MNHSGQEIHNYELRTKNYKLNKSVSFRAFRGSAKPLFSQNEPNLKTSQNNISQIIKKASIYCLLSSAPKNEPKRTQFLMDFTEQVALQMVT